MGVNGTQFFVMKQKHFNVIQLKLILFFIYQIIIFIFLLLSCCVSQAESSFRCDKMVLNDVEYNHVKTITLPISQIQKVKTAKFVPFFESHIILLLNDSVDFRSKIMIISTDGKMVMKQTQINFQKVISSFELF